MSLYNYLFGLNDEAPVLLGMLGLNMQYFDRFRDIELVKKGRIIRVFTRTGGGNRKAYIESWNKIRQHELYVTDYDDEFDNTYAYIEFKVPEQYIETAKRMFIKEPLSFKDRFEKELKESEILGTDANKRMEEMAKKLTKQLENGSENIKFIEL